MGKIQQYYLTMLVTGEQEHAIKSMFDKKSWPCYLQVLSDETVADIIQRGFIDIFPVYAGSKGIGLSAVSQEKSGVGQYQDSESGPESSDTIDMEFSYAVEDIEMRFSGEEKQDTVDNQSPTARDKQGSVDNQSPTARDKQGSVDNQSPTARDKQDIVDNQSPTARDKQDTVDNQSPTARDKQDTVDNQSPTARDKQDTVDNQSRVKHTGGRTSSRRAAVSKKYNTETDSTATPKTNRKRAKSHCTLQCIDCKLKFPSKEEFWQHRNEVKHPLPTENVPTKFNLEMYSLEEHKDMGFIKCDGCESYFLGKRRQMKHFYVVHRDLMPTPTCPICCKEFESYAELLKHKREEGHRDSLSSLNNYQCDLCGKHMTSYSNFVQHKQFVCGIGEKEMEKIRIHACDLCGKLFKSPRHVRRHKKISHFKIPEMCDICGTVCQGRKALDVHKKRHDEKNKRHVCTDCGKAFFSDSKLQEHIRTHTKEKPFKCPLCTYTCAVKPNIHKHATSVHKQTVTAVDLRKIETHVENKTSSNTYIDKDFIADIPGNYQPFPRNETGQNINIIQEMNTKVEGNSEVCFEHESKSNAYIGNGLSANLERNNQMNDKHTCMSVPITYTDDDTSKEKPTITVEHKVLPDVFIEDDFNRNTQTVCAGSHHLYYNEHSQAGTEYVPYSQTDININQYQAHIS